MNFFKSLDSIDNSIESTPIGLKVSTIEYNFNSFLQKINDGSISNNVIQNNIVYGLNSYMNYDNFKNPNTRKQFIGLWTNMIFLKNLLQLLNSNKNILNIVKSTYTTTINKISYDYFEEQFKQNSDITWNKEVSELLIDICTIVNYDYIIPLNTIMHNRVATFISMSRFSSFEQKESIERFNKMIIGSGIVFSIKDIIYIYSIFFSDGFSPLFNIIMTSDNSELTDPNQKEVFDNISFAILYILNSIPSTDIETILKKYSLYITFLEKNIARFSFKGLSSDFDRINIVVEKLLDQGYDIP